jgi:bifunctional ADP-heptose synthase (sugar kinase/adenylyltransferase)
MGRARRGLAQSLADLLADREEWRRSARSVSFTNGCFDLLHPGHIALLEAARAEGDVLVVGLNSDASVRRLKG